MSPVYQTDTTQHKYHHTVTSYHISEVKAIFSHITTHLQPHHYTPSATAYCVRQHFHAEIARFCISTQCKKYTISEMAMVTSKFWYVYFKHGMMKSTMP